MELKPLLSTTSYFKMEDGFLEEEAVQKAD